MRRLLNPVTLVVAGVLLVQGTWILALPPFRGSDEFDHAHRAAGVASGQWRLTEPADEGRGLLVWVPDELVQAAHSQCAALVYTGEDNCNAVAVSDGRARIATAAGGYNPAYYAFLGAAGALGDGVHSLYLMRIAGALLCLLCIGLGLWALRTWHRGPWAVFGVLVGLSPTLLYSTAVAAPNGIEMAAALPVWLALLGLQGRDDTRRRDTTLLLLAAAVLPLLMVPRTLGPLWLAMIGLTVMAWQGLPGVRRIVTRCTVPFAVFMAVALAAGLANVAWVTSAGGYAGEPDFGGTNDVSVAFRVHLWTLQMIAAFPFRNQPSWTWVYVLVLLVIAATVVAALRSGAGRQRRALVVALVLMVAVPILLNVATLEDRGGEYQGRYALPFVVGIMPLAGVILDEAGFAPREGFRLRILGAAMLCLAHAGSVVFVVLQELDRDASRFDEGWLRPPLGILLALAILAWACHAVALRRMPHAEP